MTTEKYHRVPQAARDVFAHSAVEPATRERCLEAFRMYFNESFNDDKRETFGQR